MAGNTINLELRLNSNISKETTAARGLREELGTVVRAAKDYRLARGTAGATGAEARDFAKQAQGLGGLVRVYATVAANAFAAASAFNALKQAADTTTLVEGLNQLGAASGISLGNLAKSFASVTDGAVSFREAASAAAKATSAGLSSRQFLQIGEGAKKASQALGIDMTDAVNRLTRGITKLEPELLDELGIYTKIGPAVEEYARKVGKAESSLTDFERRQAFAVAVLDELNKKFGEINIPSNPYQQLEASLRNLTQAGLEFINKFLQPIASIFANNSALLTIAVGGIALKLTKMAIPALTNWRDELRQSAVAAKEYAAKINETFGEKIVTRIQQGFRVPDIQAGLNRAEQAYAASQKRLEDIQKQSGEKRRGQVYKGFDIPGLTEDPNKLKRALRGIQTEINQLTKAGSDPTATPQATKFAQDRVLILQQQKKQLVDVVRLTKELKTANQQVEETVERQKTGLGEAMRSRISKQAGAAAERMGIIADIGGKVELEGFTSAIRDMYKQVGDSKQMGSFTKLRTIISGTFTAGLTQINMFLRAFGSIGQAVAIGVGLFAVFDNVFSKNTRQLEEFNKELETNKTTVENAERVMKRYKDTFITTQSISAAATSIGELSEGIDVLSEKLSASIDKQGGWDKFKDSILSWIGQGSQQDFATAVANNWAKQLELLPESEIKSAAVAKLKSILNITEISVSSITKAIAQAQAPLNIVKQGQQAVQPAITAQRELGAQATQTKESINALNKASLDLQNTFIDQSPLAKYAEALIKASQDINKSFNNIGTGIAALQEIIQKPTAFALIDQSFIAQLREIVALKNKDVEIDKQIIKTREQLEKLEEQSQRIGPRVRLAGPAGQAARESSRAISVDMADLAAGIAMQQGRRDIELNQRIAAILTTSRETFANNIREGFKILTASISIGGRQNQLEIQRSILGGIGGNIPGTARLQFGLERADIQIQKDQLEASRGLINTLTLNTLAQEEANAILNESRLLEKQKSGTLTEAEERLLVGFQKDQTQLQDLRKRITGGQDIDTDYMTELGAAAGGIALEYSRRRQGEVAQLDKLKTKERISNLNLELGLLREQQAQNEQRAKSEAELIGYRERLVTLINSNITFLSKEQLQLQQTAVIEKLKIDQALERRKIGQLQEEDNLRLQQILKENGNIENEQTKYIRERISSRAEETKNLEKQQNYEYSILTIQQKQAETVRRYNEEVRRRAFETEKRQKRSEIDQSNLDTELQLLEIANQRGRFAPDQYTQEKKRLELLIIEKQLQETLAQIEDRRLNAEKELNKEVDMAYSNMPIDPEIGASGIVAGQREAWAEERARIQERSNLETQAARNAVDNRKKIIETQIELNDRQQAYDTAFKNSFSSMADAIVSWAETGKWAGKDLFKSLLLDLARYELRLQMLQVYGGVRNTLLAPFGTSSAGVSGGMTSVSGSNLATSPFAKGDYFNKGIIPFAQGGMFTNSIVDQPTYFKFAKGTGLMGEAGPEAIMPLKRDSNGNLGVRANGQKTEVIVNNYSGVTATAEETTDSRGNRKVEVVIGEVAANDMSRSGSTSQRAMRSTFGLKPQLLRR